MSDTFNLSGDFRSATVNIKSTLRNVSQTVGSLPNADQSIRDELQQLIGQLNEELQKAPHDKTQEAEAVAESAKTLVEAVNKDKPNKVMVQITAEGLKKAAENVAGVLPTVVVIATQIVAAITKLAG